MRPAKKREARDPGQESARGCGRRAAALPILAALLAVLVVLGYTDVVEALLRDEIRTTPRSPRTGIVTGTEARTLSGAENRACLLIHGWLTSRIDFNDLAGRLNAKGLTVREMRLPGHGTTPRELAGVEADGFVRAVEEEFLDLKRSHGEVFVVGFSMGGSLGTILAAGHPVDRLVLVAPYYAVTYRWYYVIPAEVWNDLLSPFLAFVYKSGAMIRVNRKEAKEHIFSYRSIPTQSVSELCEVGRRARAPDLLSRVACPVLMVLSPGDMAASPEAAEEALGAMGSSRKELMRCERSNHHILWDYDGPAAMERIVGFLASE
jgi:carboxylesterase